MVRRQGFTFRVNDGRDDSNEGTVFVSVSPVNDPPVASIDPPERIGRGFPTLFTTTFTDDPSEGYEGGAQWGDQSFSTTGEVICPEVADPNIECEDPVITGIVISEPATPEDEGRAMAEHTYLQTGNYAARMCVVDSGNLPGCAETPVLVEEIVSLGIQAIATNETLASRRRPQGDRSARPGVIPHCMRGPVWKEGRTEWCRAIGKWSESSGRHS